MYDKTYQFIFKINWSSSYSTYSSISTTGIETGVALFQARLVENGVKTRLLKAIQETPVHHYNVEDLCPQCQAKSRQSTLKYSRTGPGYETIGWKDGDYFQNRVPSMDSINRKSITYQRSNNGSSSDVSHLYEYISDYPYEPSFNSTGRTSSHSPKLYSRTDYLKRSNSRNISDYNQATECENIQYQYSKKDKDEFRNGIHPSRMSTTSIHSQYEDRSTCPRYWTDRSPYQASGSESSNYQTRVCDKGVYKGYNSDIPPDLISETLRNLDSTAEEFNKDCLGKDEIQPTKVSATSGESSKSIKGYQYKFNPSYYDSNNSKTQQLHTDDSSTDSGIGKSRHKRKGKSRRQRSDSYNSNCSESTSLSGSYTENAFQMDKT